MSGVSDNKRIAKNAVFLYLRTFFVLVINLYMSRLVLKVLGVEDMGIYNVVGGIVMLMSFFNSAQTRATSRFITYEIGAKSSDARLGQVFNVALSIHVLIAVVVLLLGESVGFYVLSHWTEIPVERQEAAFWVYQTSLLFFIFQVLRVPYEASIIAHEEMSVYAYISIAEVFLKLGAVLSITHFVGDHLVVYGALLALVVFVVLILSAGYVYHRYRQYRGFLQWEGTLARQMFSFSGWTMLGSSTNLATQQGVSLLFNNFVGLVANTAMGFTNQVNSAVGMFVSSFTTAFNPQVIKLYAQRDYPKLHLLMCRASKFSFVLAYIVALPLIVNMDFLLQLWLDEVPQYTVDFCRLVMVCTIIDATTGVYNTTVTATGIIRNYQIGIAISFALDLLFAYMLLSFGFHPALVFSSRILTRGLINMFIGLYFVRKEVFFDLSKYATAVLLPIVATVLLSVPATLGAASFAEGWTGLFLSSLVSCVVVGCCTLFLILDKNEYSLLWRKVRRE